jgi:hypothetical protein
MVKLNAVEENRCGKPVIQDLEHKAPGEPLGMLFAGRTDFNPRIVTIYNDNASGIPDERSRLAAVLVHFKIIEPAANTRTIQRLGLLNAIAVPRFHGPFPPYSIPARRLSKVVMMLV